MKKSKSHIKISISESFIEVRYYLGDIQEKYMPSNSTEFKEIYPLKKPLTVEELSLIHISEPTRPY